jgi:xanthine dehydrogenase accessory factor
MGFWNKILSNLKQKKNVVLMIVVENKGSSPGKQGFKMAVVSDGTFFGSIGGGLTEHQLVERAKVMHTENITKAEIHKSVHNNLEEKNKSGMICSGENTVILYPLSSKHIDNINEVAGNSILGIETTVKISLTQFTSKTGAVISKQYEYGEDGIFKEVIGYKHTVFIIGGGHVGLALSKQLKILGFYVQIIDNRTNLLTIEENTFADEKHIIDFEKLDDHIPSGENIYVVIASFSHQNDKKALAILIHKKIKYLGLMGSREKVTEVFNQLKKEGISEETLKNVHAPIGVPIKSETPEEIAVSIAAEIILIKNSSKF